MSSNRIPADKSSVFNAWDIPEVKRGQVVQAEKLRQRGPRGELLALDSEEIVYNSITAQQLEEISAAAYEDVREQAYQQGLQQGHAEGYEAGLAEGQALIHQQAASLRDTIASLTTYLNGQDDEVEQALVNLATCIAGAVLRRELSIDSSQVLAIVHEAVQSLPINASNITVHLSEQDHELLKQRDDVDKTWHLQIDRTLSAGGCRVTTHQSVVDYTLEDQFQQTMNAIVEKRYAQLVGKATSSAQPAKPGQLQED